MFATCVPGPCGAQKRASDPLEQELQVAVSHCVGPGNRDQVKDSLWRDPGRSPGRWETTAHA